MEMVRFPGKITLETYHNPGVFVIMTIEEYEELKKKHDQDLSEISRMLAEAAAKHNALVLSLRSALEKAAPC